MDEQHEPADETSIALPDAQTLYVVFGPPGVGKSTVAQELADRLNAEYERTDQIRHDLVTEPTYNPEETALVYNELLDRARAELNDGRAVVIDGTFSNAQYRDRAYGLSQLTDSHYQALFVWCDKATVKDRMATRDGVSDADFAVHESIKQDFDTIAQPYVMIDNSRDLEHTFAQLDPVVGAGIDIE